MSLKIKVYDVVTKKNITGDISYLQRMNNPKRPDAMRGIIEHDGRFIGVFLSADRAQELIDLGVKVKKAPAKSASAKKKTKESKVKKALKKATKKATKSKKSVGRPKSKKSVGRPKGSKYCKTSKKTYNKVKCSKAKKAAKRYRESL